MLCARLATDFVLQLVVAYLRGRAKAAPADVVTDDGRQHLQPRPAVLVGQRYARPHLICIGNSKALDITNGEPQRRRVRGAWLLQRKAARSPDRERT